VSLRQQIKYFPFIVGIIALVVGVQISISLGQGPEHGNRNPSSFPTNDSQSFDQFDIGCSQRVVSFKTTSDQIRIKGCLGVLGAPVKIVNQATSVELTILENEDMFTTDYFKLKPNQNFLKISYRDNIELSIPINFKSAKPSK